MGSLRKNSVSASSEKLSQINELEQAIKAVEAKLTEMEVDVKISAKEDKIDLLKTTVYHLREVKFKLEEFAKKDSTGSLSGAISPTQGEKETHIQLEKSKEKIITLETENNKLRTDNEDLIKKSAEKEERAKTLMKNARARIKVLEDERNTLKEELERLVQTPVAVASNEHDLWNSAIVSMLKSLNEDKKKSKAEVSRLQRKLRQEVKRMEKLQTELQA